MRESATGSSTSGRGPGTGPRKPSISAIQNSEHDAGPNDGLSPEFGPTQTQSRAASLPIRSKRRLMQVSKAPKSEDPRKVLHDNMTNDLKSELSPKELQGKYEVRVRDYMQEERRKVSTILHWIVWRLCGPLNSDEHQLEVEAGVELAIIALKVDPRILGATEQSGGDPALHVVIGSKGLDQLVTRVCDESATSPQVSKYLKEAIQTPNSRGENCLHIAIGCQLGVATQLIEAAGNKAFTMQRSVQSEAGNGNTPLHDAVAYEQCVCKERLCKKSCLASIVAKMELWDRQCLVVDIVTKLIGKNRNALTIKNSADESPYLYHKSTARKALGEGVNSKRPPEQQDGTVPTKEEQSSKLAQNGSSTLATVSGGTSMETSRVSAGKPSQRAGSPGPKSRSEKSESETKGRTSHNTATTPDQPAIQQGDCTCFETESSCIAEKVDQCLKESAFTLGSFEQACECFFGERPDKSGRDPTFRPVRSVGFNAGDSYDFIQFTETLSHVELQVSSLADKTRSSEQQPTLDQWQNDMDSLQSIFKMLYEKGVRRILKLTVMDNPKRPCSDEVIERCLDDFDVRYLNWTKPDLCADVVLAKAPNVVELWLTSTGSNTVLRSWAANNGLCGLNKLMVLHLKANRVSMTLEETPDIPRCPKLRLITNYAFAKDLETYARYEENVDCFTEELKENIDLVRKKMFLIAERDGISEALLVKRKEIEFCEKSKSPSEKQKYLDPVEGRRDSMEQAQRSWEIQVKEWELYITECKKDLDSLTEEEKKVSKAILQCDEKKIKKEEARRMKRRASSPGKPRNQKQEDGSEGVRAGTEAMNEVPNRSIPMVFPSANGYVARDFRVSPTKAPRPVNQDNSDSELALERIDELPIKQHRWMDSIETFAKKVMTSAERPSQDIEEIKVALIDDGVDASLPDFRGLIFCPGWPRETPTSERHPFYYSSSGHGTKMAMLIKRACPQLRLYVAKLGDWVDKESHLKSLADDTTAKNAADVSVTLINIYPSRVQLALTSENPADKMRNREKAVEWAIQQKVDIISMSWTLVSNPQNESQIKDLERKIQKAAQQNIIMYCAAADQDYYNSGQTLFPKKADTNHIKAVGSSKEGGGPSEWVDHNQVDYLFPGEGIKHFKEKGSSAATALAAGFAALILRCFALKGNKNYMANPKNMHKVFQKLAYGETGKWVDVTKLLGPDGMVEVDKVVEKCKAWCI